MPAEKIVAGRRAKGWTQRQLAAEVGAHVRTVQKWEAGDSRPRNHHLLRLARVLGIDPEAISS